MADQLSPAQSLSPNPAIIRENDPYFRAAFEHAAIGMALLDADGRWLLVNRSFCQIVGRSESELRGRTFPDITHPDDLAAGLAVAAKLRTGEIPSYTLEKRYLRPDGQVVWVHLTAAAVREGSGVPTRYIAQIHDISERKQVEAARQATEARFRATFEQAAAGMCQALPDGRLVQVNRRLCDMLGYEAEELLGRSLYDVTHPEDRAESLRQIGRLVAGELAFDAREKRLVRRDGGVVWVEVARSVVRAPDGAVEAFIAVVMDISVRKRAEAALQASEARYQSIAANVPGMVYQFAFRPDGTRGYTYVSDGVQTLFGVAPEVAVQDPATLLELIHPEDRPRFQALAYEAANTLGPFRWDGRVVLRSGAERFIQIVARAHRLVDGTVVSDGLVMDLTEMRRAARQLEMSEAQFRATFDQAAVGMLQVAPADGRMLRANQRFCAMLGYTVQEIQARSFLDVTHPDDRAEDVRQVARLVAGEVQSFTLEKRYVRKDGGVVWAEVARSAVRAPGGPVETIITVASDITERKRAEAALRASEERFRVIVEHLRDVLYIAAPGSLDVQYISPAYEAIWGRPVSELYTDPRAWIDALHPEDRPRVGAAIDGHRQIPYDIEYRVVRPDGSLRWVHDRAFSVLDDHGRVTQHVGIAEDITERMQAEEAVRRSERWYRSLTENAADPVSVLSAEGVVLYASPAFLRTFGYAPEELAGTPAFDRVHPDDHAVVKAALADVSRKPGEQVAARLRYRNKAGDWCRLEASAWNLLEDPAVQGIVVNARDVTQHEALEAQLRQAQKLEAIGRLAGGIAHDFNNLLTAILSNAELVLGELPDGPAREDVEVIRQTAERAAGLTRQLLAFSRKQVIEPRLVDLNAVARLTKQMLQRTLSESVTLESDLGEIGSVLADPGQLEQVLVNLAVNASDAMPEGGTLTLRTRDVVVDEPLARRYKGLRTGNYVTLAVEDTGIGMDAATQARIFEPFFTTKEVGKGTGLGLSTVYGIAKQWGGYIAVESAPGAGSTFTVYLARHEGKAAAESTPEARLPTGTETVLVVEDETAVRNSIRRILTRQGYTVFEARHGTDALQVFDAVQRRVDLVVTDLMMPEMGGRQLIAALGARSAAPRILVMSGYDEQATRQGEGLPAGTRFLEKPFTVPGLLQSVRAALDAGGEPAPQ